MHKYKQILLPIITLITITACGDNNSSTSNDIRLHKIITNNALTGDPIEPIINQSIPDINSHQAQLGMRLFFSKSLGGDQDSACVTCHHPALGGGDGLSLPIGVGALNPDLLGPGRLHDSNSLHYDGGPPVPRNAPTTFNIACWKNALFHDGRVESVGAGIRTPDSNFGSVDSLSGKTLAQAQARFPVTSPEEMKGFNHDNKDNQGIRNFLASRMGGYGAETDKLSDTDYWLSKFRIALNKPEGTAVELITEQNIFFLIGEYERSQLFINTPWKSYIDGNNNALTEMQKKGALLFFNSVADGGANCASCHKGDFFTDEKFHNLAMPQMGRGKGDGVDKTNDFGRFRETKLPEDMYAFRTPSLINVEVTGPWSHAGAYTSLEAVVRHNLNPATALNNYDSSQLTQAGVQNLSKLLINTDKALVKLNADRLAGKEVIQNVDLPDNQVVQLVEFLKALTDPCVKERSCLAKWVVDPIRKADTNDEQLNAVDADGNLL